MPPWAAFECERTGWTFEMMPTEAPASAAASAARWPARPAPMTRTSCRGISCAASLCALSRGRRLQGPAHTVGGDDSAQAPVGVDGHERPEPGQALSSEEGLEGLVGADAEAAALRT